MKAVFHIIIGLFFALLASILVVEKNISSLMGDAEDLNKITIYFKISTLDQEAENFIQQNKAKMIKIEKISKQQALTDFKSTFGDFSKNLSELEVLNDLVPLSYDVQFPDSNSKNNFMTENKTNPLIDEIVSFDQLLARYSHLQKTLSVLMTFLFAISFGVCALMTSLLVKNLVFADAKKIEIYFLFGKSLAAVMKDYFNELSKYFAITTTISLFFVYTIFMFFKYKLQGSPDLKFIGDRLSYLPMQQIVILVLGFMLAYFGGLYFVIRQALTKVFHR